MPNVTATVKDSAGHQTSGQAAFTISRDVKFGCSQRYFTEFQTALGAPLEAERIYHGTDAPSTWIAPIGLRAIIDTTLSDDASLGAVHAKVAAFAIRPILTFDAEMERSAALPADYIARAQKFYTRLHDVADIAWCPMGATFKAGTAIDWYPGDAFVDIIACDAYAKPNSMPYPSPATVFGPALNFAKAHGKPFGIYEFGVRVDTIGSTSADRVAWINAFHSWVDANPELVMALYWESGPPVVTYDYQIRGEPDVMAAFRQMVASF